MSPALQFVLVLVGCVASGTLECSPEPDLSPTQKRGAALYGKMCAVCHGRTADGYAADQAPALSHQDFLTSVNDEYLRSAIADGRAGTTMSAWATRRGGPLAPADVDALIARLRAWEFKPRAHLDESPTEGNSAHGEVLFARECTRCHGPRGVGGPYVHIGSRDFLASASNGFLRAAMRDGRSDTPMPAFAQRLGNDGIDDLLSLLRSWQSSSDTTPRAAPAKPPPLALGPVPLNPRGPEPQGFQVFPKTTPAEVIKSQLDRKAKMALLDARAPSDYLHEHIVGAVSVPFYDPDPYFDALPRDAWLVCYCACPHAESGQLAQKLQARGFTKVTVLDEGLGFWRSKGYPLATGVEP